MPHAALRHGEALLHSGEPWFGRTLLLSWEGRELLAAYRQTRQVQGIQNPRFSAEK